MVDLPPANTKRWVARRKAAVVMALRERMLTIEEACLRYALSEEELRSWQQAFEADGIAGLGAGRLRAGRLRASGVRASGVRGRRGR
jgi:hypothetical protein